MHDIHGAATEVAERNMESHINATKVASPKETILSGAATLVTEDNTSTHTNAIEIASPEEATQSGAATSVADTIIIPQASLA